jgi:hypothetical protein
MLLLALAGIGSTTLFTLLVFFFAGVFSSSGHAGGHFGVAWLIALYPSTLAGVFFNVALACAASAAFDGERLSAGEALRMAYGKRRRIALWALISSVVGTLIAEVANRLPGGGRIVAWFAGAAWGLATIFVIPILAIEGIGPVDALKRSTGLVKSRWGEGISGRVAIGAWSVVAIVPLAIGLGVGVALLDAHPATGATLIGGSLLGLVATVAAVAATQQVFAVALYRDAIGAPIGGFAASDMAYPFVADPVRQKRKSWILRIGVPILALLLVLIVIGIIVGSNHHRYPPADGYFGATYGAREAAELPRGTPVIFGNQVVGTIVGSEPMGTRRQVVFHVEPGLSWLKGGYSVSIAHDPRGTYLRIRELSR